MRGRTDHVVVVGAGLSGLCAALHLLGAGRQVTIVERADHPGGRVGQLDLTTEHGTFHVDTGATVLTMPDLLDEAFAAVGEKLAERLDLLPLDPAYRAHFADGSTIDVHTDADAMEAEIRRVCGPESAVGYRGLREWLGDLYRTEIDTFIGANIDSPFSLLGPDLVRLARLGGFGRLGPRVARFLPDDRLRRIFSFQSLYAGVAPDRALGAYGVIAYMDTVAGVWFPRGGMRTVGRALADGGRGGRGADPLRAHGHGAAAARRSGHSGAPPGERRAGRGQRSACRATPSCSRRTSRSSTRWSAARGGAPCRCGGRPAPWCSTRGCAPGVPKPRTTRSPSAGRGSGRSPRSSTTGRLMSDPSLLVTRPTASDPTLAPPGNDLLFVLAPCPNLERGRIDWARVGPAYRDELLAVLAARGHPGLDDIAGDITVSRLVTPAEWAADGLAAGTPFSAAHTLAQTGPFRPRNLVPGLDNAVLAGCGTVPGVGIPPVVLSGKLAAQRITGSRRGHSAG